MVSIFCTSLLSDTLWSDIRFIMAVLWHCPGHYIFALWFLSSCSFFLACFQRSEIGCLSYFYTSRVPCTKVLSQEIQIFQETSFCVLQVLLRNFTNMLWQLYIDFYTIRMVFESSFQLCTFKLANLKKLWRFWQKCVDRTFVHVKHGAV